MHLRLNQLLPFFVLFFPSLALWGNDATFLTLFFLLLLSIYFVVKESITLRYNYIFPLFVTFILVFILSIPNVILDEGRLAALDVPVRYLICSILLLSLSYKQVAIKYLFYGILMSSIVGFFLYPVYYGWFLDSPRYKGTLLGDDVKILYIAYQSMLNVSISSVGLYYFVRKQNNLGGIGMLISILASVVIGLMSGSKVILLNVFFPLFFIFLSIKKLSTRGRLISVMCIVFFCFSFVLTFPKTKLYQRVNYAIEHIDTGEKGSTNYRIDMIKLSWWSFKKSPVWGMGYNALGEYREKLIDEGILILNQLDNKGRGSLHTEIGNTAAKKGLIGLTFIFLLYIVPIYISRKLYLKDARNEFSFYLTCSLVVTFFTAGLTESLLMRIIPSMYFILMLTLILLTHNKETVKMN